MKVESRTYIAVLTALLITVGVAMLALSIKISHAQTDTFDVVLDDVAASFTEPSIKKMRKKSNPFDNETLFVSTDTDASRTADVWETSAPQDAAELRKIAAGSVAIWFGDWNGKVINRQVRETVRSIRKQGALPVLVAYNIPNRNCGLYSAGGAEDAESYLRWITSMAEGIGNRSAVVILEPDALSETECLDSEQSERNLDLLGKAVEILKSAPRTSVYIDAGNAEWIDPVEMASRLERVRIDLADGFSLNVSNFLEDEVNISYGEKLSTLTGGKHFVIDTSRNGQGPAPGYAWCNPSGRGLGRSPTIHTNHELLDAYLWIKQPGESDGECNGGPPAGVWWPEYALELAKNSQQPK